MGRTHQLVSARIMRHCNSFQAMSGIFLYREGHVMRMNKLTIMLFKIYTIDHDQTKLLLENKIISNLNILKLYQTIRNRLTGLFGKYIGVAIPTRLKKQNGVTAIQNPNRLQFLNR